MTASLALDQMTTAEKLRAMEELWEDLARNPADVPVPNWHRDVLEQRQATAASGEARFRPWDDAKRRLRNG